MEPRRRDGTGIGKTTEEKGLQEGARSIQEEMGGPRMEGNVQGREAEGTKAGQGSQRKQTTDQKTMEARRVARTHQWGRMG